MRKLMWFTMGFGAACAFGVYLGVEGLLGPAFFAGCLSVILLVGKQWQRNFRLPGTVLLGLCLGLGIFCLYDGMYLAPARALDGQTGRVTLYVREYSYPSAYGTACEATVVTDGRAYPVRVYLDGQWELTPGNRLQGTFLFSAASDEDKDLYERSLGLSLTAVQDGNVTAERCWKTGIWDLPALWRQELTRIIDTTFSSDTAGFAKALLLGDRSDLDYETNTDLRISGVSHIVAVSGMHVSILFGLISLMSGRRRYFTLLLGIPVVIAFAALVGFTPSVNRAVVMQILVMLAMACNREYDGPTALSFAALVLLLCDPTVIASVSFQLSFGCMAGILGYSESIRDWLLQPHLLGRWDSGPIRFLASSVSISLGASVFTLPLCGLYFGTVSLIGPLTNLLTLWAITYIFYAVMAVCGLWLLSAGAASALAAATAWPIRYVLECSGWLADFPLAAVYLESKYIAGWLVLFCLLLLVFLIVKRKPVALFTGLSALSLCLALGFSWAEPLLDPVWVTVLDVGQGQCILVQTEGRSVMIDCGSDDPEKAADKAAETLLSQGVSRLDAVIVTHYDTDHAGGIPCLLTRIEVDAVFLPFSADDSGLGAQLRALAGPKAMMVWEDTKIDLGRAQFTLYAPESYNSGNESSMCILFDSENCDILITGDRGQVGERLLLRHAQLPQVDILIAGHHGARDSTTAALLEAVRPKYVFISVGEDNRYGHPHPELLARLMEYCCAVYCTDECGTVIYRG